MIRSQTGRHLTLMIRQVACAECWNKGA